MKLLVSGATSDVANYPECGIMISPRSRNSIRFTEDDLAEYVESCAVSVRGVPEPKVKTGPLKWITINERA